MDTVCCDKNCSCACSVTDAETEHPRESHDHRSVCIFQHCIMVLSIALLQPIETEEDGTEWQGTWSPRPVHDWIPGISSLLPHSEVVALAQVLNSVRSRMQFQDSVVERTGQ